MQIAEQLFSTLF